MTDIKLSVVVCQKCDHKWIPRVSDPKKCPNCQSKDWNKQKKGEEEEE